LWGNKVHALGREKKNGLKPGTEGGGIGKKLDRGFT